MQFLTTLKIILELVPMIITAIKAIEEAIPGQGSGEQKLALIRTVLESGYTSAKDATVAFEQVWPVLATVIETLVKTFNNTGVFKK